MRRLTRAPARAATCLVVWMLVSCAGTSADAATDVLTGYSVTAWTETDAGPLGAVSAIVQDNEGYLWVGTSLGLFRFDGTRFLHWNDLGDVPLPASSVSALLLGRDGTLWVGFANRAGIARINGRTLHVTDRGPVRLVNAIVEDRDGVIWVVADPDLYRLTATGWEQVPVRSGTIDARIVNGGTTSTGTLWAGATSGLFMHAGANSFTRVAEGWTWSVSEGADGTVWLTDTVRGFRQQREKATGAVAVDGNGYRLLHDRQGYLWVATIGEGLWRVRTGSKPNRIEKATLSSPVFSDSVQALLEDREGNLWAGTTAGLHRFTRQKLTPLTNVGHVMAAAADGENVWAGTYYGVVRFVQANGTWEGQRLAGPSISVNTMHRDRSGIVWVGADEGLWRVAGNRLHAVTLPSEHGLRAVRCLSSDSRGLWLGDGATILHWDGTRFSPLTLPPDVPAAGAVCIHNDARDRLWIGFRGARLLLREADGTYTHLDAETLGSDASTIHGVFESSDGTIWVATNAGVTRFGGGRAFTFRQTHGLPSDRVWAVLEDEDNSLWLSLDAGVVRVEPAEFEAAATDAAHRIRYEWFDTSDGLAGAPILRVRAGGGTNGTIWFLRGGALTVGETRVLARWPKLAVEPVRIERAFTDERTLDTASPGDLSSGTKRLQIDFTAISLTQPGRLRFRYKLEGFDTEWIPAGTRRSAVYTNLPPRSYRFVAEAGTDREGWSGASAVWEFSLAPAFYQTAWFYALVLCATGVGVWGAWRIRVDLVHREYAAVLAERTRLSREIHDTLLQGVVGVALQLDAISHTVGAISTEARDALVRTRRQVETYIREARQSIFDLRSPLLEARALPELLKEVGRDATASTPVTFTLNVAGRVRRCPPRLENELLRIGREAILNAVRHARAQRIRLELSYGPDTVALTVVDDGRGITSGRDVDVDGEAHYGLIVMKERAENLGGRVRIAPLPEGGTRIEAVLPVPAAA